MPQVQIRPFAEVLDGGGATQDHRIDDEGGETVTKMAAQGRTNSSRRVLELSEGQYAPEDEEEGD
ncbi:hypothetical protein HKX48_000513, partial [Thoreauomyces humboldtii]